MEISRLIFSKETKKKMEEGLNAAQRGKLRWDRIKEAEEHGSLALARNRYEVANIAGFTKENKSRGYQWVSNMIARKHLQEIIQGVGKNGLIEYEYHTVDDPDYSRQKARDARQANQDRRNAEKQKQVSIERDLTSKERGKMMFNKLKDLDKDGILAKAKSRAEVASLAGYTDDQAKSGYSWVSSLIRKGYIKESFLGVSPSGNMLVKYELGDSEPMYDNQESTGKRERVKDVQAIVPVENNSTIQIAQKEEGKAIKIKMSRGDINIEVEVEDCDQAIKLITTILKGEQLCQRCLN